MSLGLQTGLKTAATLRLQTAWRKRLIGELYPGLHLTSWAVYSGACWSHRIDEFLGPILVPVAAVRCGLFPYILDRAETLADCVSTAGTFYWDPCQAFNVNRPRWDDGTTHWDDGATKWDETPELYVHLPGSVAPSTTTVEAELLLVVGGESDVIPELGPEKIENGGFELWSGGDPDSWSVEKSILVTVTEETAILAKGSRSVKLSAPGGDGGTWDDGTTTWDGSIKWDAVDDPVATLSKTTSLVAGARYRLSGAYRTAVDNDSTIHAYLRLGIPGSGEYVENDGFGYAGTWLQLAETRGEWRRFRLDFIAWSSSSTAEVALRMWTGGGASGPAGDVYFDDVTLRRIWRFQFVEPWLDARSVPTVSQDSRDIFHGGKAISGGSLGVITAHGDLDSLFGRLDWNGRTVRLWGAGAFQDGQEIGPEDYWPVFSGVIDDEVTWSDTRATIGIRDNRQTLNVQVPTDVITETDFGDLAAAFSGEARRWLFGPKTNITGVPIILTANGYRTYEVADPTLSPAGIHAISSVYAYVDGAAAADKDEDRRIELDEGDDYSTDLPNGRVTILKDCQIIEVLEDENRLDFTDDSGTHVATLTAGIYTPSRLATHVKTQMKAVGDSTLDCTYSETDHTMTVSNGGGASILSLLRSTGDNRDLGAWRILGFESGDDLTGALSYEAETALFTDPDTEHIVRIDATGYKDDASGTYTGTAGAAIQLGPDIVRCIVSAFLRRPDIIDDLSFDTARTLAPEILGIYLRDVTNFREVLDRIEYSVGADIVFDADGLLYFTVADDTVSPDTVELSDSDLLDFEQGIASTDVHRLIVVEYDEDPSTRKALSRTAENSSVPVRYDRADLKPFQTYLTSSSDAGDRAAEIAAEASAARFTATVKVKGALSASRIGSKARITRSRAVASSGSLSQQLFRVLGIKKQPLASRVVARLLEV